MYFRKIIFYSLFGIENLWYYLHKVFSPQRDTSFYDVFDQILRRSNKKLNYIFMRFTFYEQRSRYNIKTAKNYKNCCVRTAPKTAKLHELLTMLYLIYVVYYFFNLVYQNVVWMYIFCFWKSILSFVGSLPVF